MRKADVRKGKREEGKEYCNCPVNRPTIYNTKKRQAEALRLSVHHQAVSAGAGAARDLEQRGRWEQRGSWEQREKVDKRRILI